MADEDDKNLAAAPASDSVPPEAPTVVTELPADLRMTARSPSFERPASPSKRPPLALRRPTPPPPPTSSSAALAVEAAAVDESWGPAGAPVESNGRPDSVDVEAPTIAAALDTSSLANIPLPASLVDLVPPPPSVGRPVANMPSPLAYTHSAQDVASLASLPGMRQTAKMSPPGPAEAPWANPNAPRREPPPVPGAFMDQPSAIGWAIGGIFVLVTLIALVIWLVLLLIGRFS